MQMLFTSDVPCERHTGTAHLQCHVRKAAQLQWVSVSVRGALDMTSLQLQHATIDAYDAVRGAMRDGPGHPIRFWNFIPDINRHVDHGLDRYMIFNAGRHAAYTAWHGDAPHRERRIVTASGVGHRGDDLVIHCLAADSPGTAVENPRQTPAYRYSERFGPFPPGFARATMVRGHSFPNVEGDLLLIGGTASICGERSVHEDRLSEQVQETLVNLAAVIRSAERSRRRARTCGGVPDEIADRDEALSRIVAWRIYFVRQDDRAALEAMLAGHMRGAEDAEWVHADLCRPELLVEIEALAAVPAAARGPSQNPLREHQKLRHV